MLFLKKKKAMTLPSFQLSHSMQFQNSLVSEKKKAPQTRGPAGHPRRRISGN